MTLLESRRTTLPLTLLIAFVLVLPAAHAPATNADFASQIARLKATHDPVSVLLASAAIGGWEPSPQDLAWQPPAIDPTDPAPLVGALVQLYASQSAVTDAQLRMPISVNVASTLTQTYAMVPLTAQRAIVPVVLTVAHASVLTNQAFARLTPVEREELALTVLHHEAAQRAKLRAEGLPADHTDLLSDSLQEYALEAWATFTPSPLSSPRLAELVARVNMTPMITAAVLVTRAGLDARAPIQEAVASGQWPLTQIQDPIGILDLGTSGNDLHTGRRWVIIDPAGDDLYRGSSAGASGGGILPYVAPGPQNYLGMPVGLAVDYAGNDRYLNCDFCEGAAVTGVGILLDTGAGNDTYQGADAQGSANIGVALLYDDGGNDKYTSGSGTGYAFEAGLGVAYDKSGNDTYWSNAGDGLADGGLGAQDYLYMVSSTVGVLKDDNGSDWYGPNPYGYGTGPYSGEIGDSEGVAWCADCKGILLDEGSQFDWYGQPYARDNSTWQYGFNLGTGYGNDS